MSGAESLGAVPPRRPEAPERPSKLEAVRTRRPRESRVDKIERVAGSASSISERLKTMGTWMEAGKRVPKDIRDGISKELKGFKFKEIEGHQKHLRKEVSKGLGWPSYDDEFDETFFENAFRSVNKEIGPRFAKAHESASIAFEYAGQTMERLSKDVRLTRDFAVKDIGVGIKEVLAQITAWKDKYPEAGENGILLLGQKGIDFAQATTEIGQALDDIIEKILLLLDTRSKDARARGNDEKLEASSLLLSAVLDNVQFIRKTLTSTGASLARNGLLKRYTAAVNNKAAYDRITEAHKTVLNDLGAMPSDKGQKADRDFLRNKKASVSAPKGAPIN